MFSFFFQDVGKKIRILALILALITTLVFLVFGAICLINALADGVNETLRKTGIQAAVISFALAALCPFLSFPLIGLGTLVIHAERRAESDRRVEELLQKAIGEGLLADDIARGVGNAIADKLTVVQSAPVAAPPSNAPVQRFVEEIEEKPAPAQKAAPVMPKKAPVAPVIDTTGYSASVQPLRPIGTEEQF